jgi:hypothetical protein
MVWENGDVVREIPSQSGMRRYCKAWAALVEFSPQLAQYQGQTLSVTNFTRHNSLSIKDKR